MSKFHVIVHAMPKDGEAATASSEKFDRSFEDVSEAFEALPRMFLEPDGSFVWVVDGSGCRFQLDGLLTDDGVHLLHCELKGHCDNNTLDQLLTALGWPKRNVGFQLVQEGTFLSEAQFREQFIE